MLNSPQISWEDVYQIWRLNAPAGPGILREPLHLKEIYVDHTASGSYIYGYDWLPNEEYPARQKMIETYKTGFLYLIEPTHKGTLHTLHMLLETKDDEERAAIWIYAFCKEILDTPNTSLQRLAFLLCNASRDFLSSRFAFWHHAMKKLVPKIFINFNLIMDTDFRTVNAVMELARLNAALTLYEYTPICYTSLAQDKRPANYTIRRS